MLAAEAAKVVEAAEAEKNADKKDQAAEDTEATVAPAVEEKPAKESIEQKMPKWFNLGWGLAGVGGLVGSAALVVSSAVAFGAAVGISPVVVGLLAVSVGTSLPELMVSIKSALKGDANMSVGNILGSNVFNILAIGGMLALAGTPVPASLTPQATATGLLNTAAFGASALLLTAAMAKSKGKLNRAHGLVGMGLYAAFTAANLVLGRGPDADAAAVAKAAMPAAPALPGPT